MIDSCLADLRYGLRLLRNAPVFTIVTIGTLALGIGANTAIFSVVDAALVRSLPIRDADRVVMVWEDASFAGFPKNTPAPGNYAEWARRNHVFADIAASRGGVASLTADGQPEQVIGRGVTSNFFTVLGVQPALGRAFTADEDRTGALVVVISDGLWRRRYGGDPAIVGKTMLMNGVPHSVIGVMPRRFVFRNREFDYWIPAHFTPAESVARGNHYLQVVARLAPGVTLAQAREEMTRIARQLAAAYPDTNARSGIVVVPIREDVLGNTRVELLVLMAAAGCVLLIACANLASLLLSRAVGRRAEMAIRAAIGATQGRLVRQLLVEATLLSLAGGMLGILLAPAGITIVARLLPIGLDAGAASVDARLLAFGVALSLLTGIFFSLVPATQAARASLSDAMQRGSRSVAGGSRTTRDALVVLQVAAALVLLVGAGLMLRTLANLRALDVGFRADHLLTLRTSLPRAKYPANARLAFYQRVLDGVRAIPGVRMAAYSSLVPFLSRGNTIWYRIDGRTLAADDPGDALYRVATGDYLKTLGVRLVEGRLPDERDGVDAPKIVVVNETFARRYWPDESALGHRVKFGSHSAPFHTIVGVVRDVRERGYDVAMKPGVYLPYAQTLDTWALPEVLVMRVDGDPQHVAGAARQVIAAVDPEQPVAAVRTMDDIIDLEVADRQEQMVLLTAFASLALLLASLGLYGVLSYAVTQRSREIGLRVALGARPGDVVRMIVGRGLALTAVGVAIGIVLAVASTRVLIDVLYGVPPIDRGTFAASVLVLGIVALAACALPARRAARLNPMRVLRQE